MATRAGAHHDGDRGSIDVEWHAFGSDRTGAKPIRESDARVPGAAAGTTRAAHTDTETAKTYCEQAAREPRAHRAVATCGWAAGHGGCGDCFGEFDIVAAWAAGAVRRARRQCILGVDLHREHSRGSGTTETLSHDQGCASAEPARRGDGVACVEPFRRIARFRASRIPRAAFSIARRSKPCNARAIRHSRPLSGRTKRNIASKSV